jgi:2-polyprenyl-3-methyl-5-hydroxy-6-metoxy-1,4-benzoquinol methylase
MKIHIGVWMSEKKEFENENQYDKDTQLDDLRKELEYFQKESPRLRNRVSCDSLPNLSSLHNKSVDGILCSAVLMHLPKEELFDCIFNLKRILKQNGKILLSIPVLLDDENINSATNRDTQSRLFNGITPDNLHLLFERLGFVLISQ